MRGRQGQDTMTSGGEKSWFEDIEFSDSFCKFIQLSIPESDAAELLLLFHGKPETAFSIEEAVEKLGPGISISNASKYMKLFQSRGLVLFAEGRYRYNPRSEDASLVTVLARAYTQRPVTLIRIIYALRDSKIQSFAEAFKLRKGRL